MNGFIVAYQPIDAPKVAGKVSAGAYKWLRTGSLSILFEWSDNCGLWSRNNPVYLGIFLELYAVVLDGIELESKPFDRCLPFLIIFEGDLQSSKVRRGKLQRANTYLGGRENFLQRLKDNS